jgi:hypothetical protein
MGFVLYRYAIPAARQKPFAVISDRLLWVAPVDNSPNLSVLDEIIAE